MAAGPSLKGRAIRWLAQREHSRIELRRKLLPHVAAASVASATDEPASASASTSPAAEVDQLLDWLEAQGLLSPQRFVESRVQARAARLGHRRIAGELAMHGLALPPELAQSLRASELERAHALWARRFGSPAADVAEQARQARFLVGRGFSADVVRRVVRGVAGSDADTDT